MCQQASWKLHLPVIFSYQLPLCVTWSDREYHRWMNTEECTPTLEQASSPLGVLRKPIIAAYSTVDHAESPISAAAAATSRPVKHRKSQRGLTLHFEILWHFSMRFASALVVLPNLLVLCGNAPGQCAQALRTMASLRQAPVRSPPTQTATGHHELL